MKHLDEGFIELVRELLGDEGAAVVSFLSENFDVTDEMLAQKTGIKLNNVRKILYALYDNQLVSYKRVRDKTTGWFIYFWRLNKDNVEFIVRAKKHAVLKKLRERLEYEKKYTFMHCPKDRVKMPFEEAIDYDFKCKVCGETLEFFDNSKIVSFLEKKIKEIEDDIFK
ncbi:MAG: transcription factor E [Candidatus Methanomethylicia archaeon]|nr:transcription factor E [Candidatus Methanomethylicia archaeon]MCX8169087.1 transcription factor E [Candidatus Methanomethylicia archaeon]MDW7988819.1 transcription factor E [Nitrososphaerota archaeon]